MLHSQFLNGGRSRFNTFNVPEPFCFTEHQDAGGRFFAIAGTGENGQQEIREYSAEKKFKMNHFRKLRYPD
jgi:hypothetical protein